jgi:phage terminase large subunit-like protein
VEAMSVLIFERAVHIDQDGGLRSYWPERWPLTALAGEYGNGSAFFAASYMNDPSLLEGNCLKTDWLHLYTEDELRIAREAAGVSRGIVYTGIDPTQGGEGDDPDFMAMFTIEVIDQRGFALDFHYTRKPVEEQADEIEAYLQIWKPNFVRLEEASSRGFVYAGLTTGVNGGQGSIFNIEVKKPQGSKDKGGKKIRFLAMAAHAENSRLRFPSIITPQGNMIIDPRWAVFAEQWRTFPSGHDDILDAMYWATEGVWTEVEAGGAAQSPDEVMDKDDPRNYTEEELVIPAVDRRGRRTRPIGQQRRRDPLTTSMTRSMRWNQ